ncbi:MAG: prepilin-type N-terminal cleavage/methylation domain-containing protein [Candidatus Acidiferrales bacterium]
MRLTNANPYRPTGRTSERGFSLVELLIVVAVILIIAAIAIPNFITSKLRANESAAIENIRTITSANVVYSTTWQTGYAASLATLGGNTASPTETAAGLLDSVLSSGNKSGYSYSYSAGPVDVGGNIDYYTLNAAPEIPGQTGVRYFYTDQTAVIRYNSTTTAGPTDLPIS